MSPQMNSRVPAPESQVIVYWVAVDVVPVTDRMLPSEPGQPIFLSVPARKFLNGDQSLDSENITTTTM